MEDISKYINNGNLKIIVKPKSKKTEINGYDNDKKAVLVSITAIPENNKANLEVIKYFSKILKKKVRIKSGLTSKEKILHIDL
jgi:uncharacterized protein